MSVPDGEHQYVSHPLLESNAVEHRKYQLDLAETARDDNTLVCLPTGLGKTAVSLLVTADRLNHIDGKALLLAPTKPLVRQHADDYRDWLTIPREEIVVYTGSVKPGERAELWDTAKIIVATPQVIENDLIGSRIQLDDVVHVTFDECHRATGNYAYTYIAERYHADATNPLVTGLSASPGSDKEAILQVCENLGITQVTVKTEDDTDVSEYSYRTNVEWIQIALPDEINELRTLLRDVIRDRLGTLKELGVVRSTDTTISQKDLNKARGKLQRLIDDGDAAGYQGMSIHAEVMKLRRAVELVETQSVAALRRYFERQKNAARSSGASKASQRLVADPKITEAMRRAAEYNELHPKYRRARMLIAETLGIDDGERVIVFTESRDTAEMLTEFLGQHFDVKRFVGQGDREGSDGMTQREQQETLDGFRAGECEVLVSTSVAEEGLDVPEVDLVLFYEPVPTAIRSIQRKGRTGRGTEGRVVVLIAEDTRDEAYFWKSRHEEDRMENELRTLKAIAGDVETELYDDQRGLEDFANTTSSVDESTQSESTENDTVDSTSETPDRAGESSGVEIVVDQRELDATIARDLSKRDSVSVRLETLAVGDYVLSDRVVAERKTVSDFLDTLVGNDDRSLFEQMGDMRRHYQRPVLLIEGERNLYEERNVHPNAIRGALASIAVDFGVSVLWTIDESDSVELLTVIAKREQERENRVVSAHGEKSSKTLVEQQEYVVSSIGEVGPVTARSLLSAFGSVEAVMTASSEELQSVKGVGEMTAERIRSVVESPYDP